MNRKALAAAIAGSVLAALAAAPKAGAANPEACYGISLKGQNDCASKAHSCAGQATADYDRSDFKTVPAGTCTKMVVDGHQGSLTPS